MGFKFLLGRVRFDLGYKIKIKKQTLLLYIEGAMRNHRNSKFLCPVSYSDGFGSTSKPIMADQSLWVLIFSNKKSKWENFW